MVIYQFGPWKFTQNGIDSRASDKGISVHEVLLDLMRTFGQPVISWSK